MRIKSFGHDRLKGNLLRGSEINKRFGHSRTQYSSPTTHAVSRLCLHFYSYIVDILVRIGATWSARS